MMSILEAATPPQKPPEAWESHRKIAPRYSSDTQNSRSFGDVRCLRQARVTPPATPAAVSLASAMARDAQQREEPWQLAVRATRNAEVVIASPFALHVFDAFDIFDAFDA